MATSAQLRRNIASLTVLASSDLDVVLREVSTQKLTEQALFDVLPTLVQTYGTAAAAVAADWYDNRREHVGVKGRFRAFPADIADSGTGALVGWASATASTPEIFQGFILGGLQRRIANFSRLTVTQSSIADPQARGWMRVGDGNSCDFCSMLLGRGAVYTEATADFEAHDRCGCTAEPEFG